MKYNLAALANITIAFSLVDISADTREDAIQKAKDILENSLVITSEAACIGGWSLEYLDDVQVKEVAESQVALLKQKIVELEEKVKQLEGKNNDK